MRLTFSNKLNAKENKEKSIERKKNERDNMINTAVDGKIDCDYLLHVCSHSCLITTSLPSVALGIHI